MSARNNSVPRCRQVLRVLQSYLDGVLDERTAAQVARHLEGCRPCVLEAGTYLAIKSALARRGRRPPTAVRRLPGFGVAGQDGPGGEPPP